MKKLLNPWIDLPGYNCFGCAPNNFAGVQMTFFEDGENIVSVWKPKPQFQGWINTLHGGIQAVLLDEICAWVVIRKLKTTGVTAKMETHYRKAISTEDSYLILESSLIEMRRNIATIKATISNSNHEICTEAICTYFTFPPEKASKMYFKECETIGDDLSLDEVIALL